jgi:metal-responsive CopG/Arc/MetJ family transcriptional regulator
MENHEKMLTVRLSAPLYQKAEQAMERRGIGNLGEFVARVLEEYLAKDEGALSDKETEILKERLKGLGYI